MWIPESFEPLPTYFDRTPHLWNEIFFKIFYICIEGKDRNPFHPLLTFISFCVSVCEVTMCLSLWWVFEIFFFKIGKTKIFCTTPHSISQHSPPLEGDFFSLILLDVSKERRETHSSPNWVSFHYMFMCVSSRCSWPCGGSSILNM